MILCAYECVIVYIYVWVGGNTRMFERGREEKNRKGGEEGEEEEEEKWEKKEDRRKEMEIQKRKEQEGQRKSKGGKSLHINKTFRVR